MKHIITSLCLASSMCMATPTAELIYIDASEDMRVFVIEPSDINPLHRDALPAWIQNPARSAGVRTHERILEKMRQARQVEKAIAWKNWEFFPSQPQKFAPYLDSLFVLGNSCLEPSEMIHSDPLSRGAQHVKSMASSIGINYDLTLAVNYTAIPSGAAGQKRSLTSFTGEFWGAWTLAKTRDDSYGVFMMMEANWGRGMGYSQRNYNAQNSTGSLINPQGSYVGGNGPFISNLSLGVSAFDGKFVFMAGTMDPTNFLDQNAYAADWDGNLMNAAFIYNPTLPLLWANWAHMTAIQFHPNFYALYYNSGTQTTVNHNPFNHINNNHWVHLTEFGFILDDDSSMGAGTYRFQYAITEDDSETGAGAAINIQQQLGRHNPMGFFSRVGYNDPDAARITGVKAAATAGLVLQAPFSSHGWGSKSNNEQLALGFYWARAAEEQKPYSHKDEYGLELTAVFQITPTFFIQPDIQYIFNPVHSRENDDACILQIQSVWRF